MATLTVTTTTGVDYRCILRRGLTASEVEALNRRLATALADLPAEAAPPVVVGLMEEERRRIEREGAS